MTNTTTTTVTLPDGIVDEAGWHHFNIHRGPNTLATVYGNGIRLDQDNMYVARQTVPPLQETDFVMPGVGASGFISDLIVNGFPRNDYHVGPFRFQYNGDIYLNDKPLVGAVPDLVALFLKEAGSTLGLARPSELYFAMNYMIRTMEEIRDTCSDCDDQSCNRCRIITSTLAVVREKFNKLNWRMIDNCDKETSIED